MRRVYLTIFLVSSSVLIFEISLTRIFSIYLSYHFAFMVISIAMLGMGCAGTILALSSLGRQRVLSEKRIKLLRFSGPHISVYATLAGISMLACYIISNHIPFDPVQFSWDKKQFLYLALYCFVFSIPFFFSGLLIATVFFLHSEKSMSIYGADLLGAGAGSLSVLAILGSSGPEYAVFIASTMCLVGSFAAGSKRMRMLTSALIVLNLLIFSGHSEFLTVRMSPYKKLPLMLKYPGAEHLNTYYNSYSRIDTFRSPAVRFAPGLSLGYLHALPEQAGLSVDGTGIHVITDGQNSPRLEFLKFLPSSLAYELKEKSDVLVLNAGGGLQVLIAKYYDSRRIHMMESNAMIPIIFEKDFPGLSGDIFNQNTGTGYGRTFLAGNRIPGKESIRFDIIDIPMTDTSVSGSFGISEDYRYTVEAFHEYLESLKEDGMISINLYLVPPPRTEFRLLATIGAAFEKMGIEDTGNRVAALRSWDSMVILIRKTPFKESEISHMKAFARDRRFDLVYYPGIKEGESNRYIKMPVDEYFIGFNKILNRKMRSPFIHHYLFDINPVYDDTPFFHYYLRLDNIQAIYETMGRNPMYFINEGYLLPVVFIMIFILSLAFIIVPVFFLRKSRKYSESAESAQARVYPSLSVFTYFAMLGLGFMFVEVPLIQKSILLFENPSYSVAVILTSILISSGIGSMASSKFIGKRAAWPLPVLCSLVMVYSILYPVLANSVIAHSLQYRVMAMAFLLMPIGFFMGMPFPLGLRIIGQKSVELIPWAWAINACLSVLAPILTIMIALVIGFTAVMWIGAAAYLLACVSLGCIMKS